MAPGTVKRFIVTLISFYRFNGNYVTVVVRKVDTLVKWRRSLLEESPAISSKLGALVEETHLYDYGDNPGTYYGGKGAFKAGKFRLNRGILANL